MVVVNYHLFRAPPRHGIHFFIQGMDCTPKTRVHFFIQGMDCARTDFQHKIKIEDSSIEELVNEFQEK